MKKQLLTATIAVTILCVSCGTTTGDKSTVDNNAHLNHTSVNSNVENRSNANVDHSAHSTMDHSAMQSSPGAATTSFELQFLDSMIAHHQGAVEMAMLAATRAEREELKELAASIIDEQEREIAKMSEWRNSWFDGKPAAINMEFPGMSRGMQGMDTKKLKALMGKDFDAEFIRQMIPHHEGAIEMANALKNGKARAELLQIAEDIITAQDAEIRQMKEWSR